MATAKRWESEVIPDIHTIHRGDRNRNELAQRALTGDIRAVHGGDGQVEDLRLALAGAVHARGRRWPAAGKEPIGHDSLWPAVAFHRFP